MAMSSIGMKASSMIDGAFSPTIPSPFAVATTKPRLAASEYAGAVEAIPITTLETKPRAPVLRPFSSATSGNPMGAASST